MAPKWRAKREKLYFFHVMSIIRHAFYVCHSIVPSRNIECEVGMRERANVASMVYREWMCHKLPRDNLKLPFPPLSPIYTFGGYLICNICTKYKSVCVLSMSIELISQIILWTFISTSGKTTHTSSHSSLSIDDDDDDTKLSLNSRVNMQRMARSSSVCVLWRDEVWKIIIERLLIFFSPPDSREETQRALCYSGTHKTDSIFTLSYVWWWYCCLYDIQNIFRNQ